MRNIIFPTLLLVPIVAAALFWTTVSAETISSPTVSNNRFCDLDKAAGSGITITNTSNAAGTARTIFYTEEHHPPEVKTDLLSSGQVLSYQPLPAFLSASYKGWALLSDINGQFSAEAHAPGVMHSVDFSVAIPNNLNLVFLTPIVLGENCYNKYAVDWGDGSAITVEDKGSGPLFHGYAAATESYTVTLTTRLNNSEIVSHSEQVDIVISTVTAVGLAEFDARHAIPLYIFGLFLTLTALAFRTFRRARFT